MTNTEALTAIVRRVNEDLPYAQFDAGPPAVWTLGSKCAMLAEDNGDLAYSFGATELAWMGTPHTVRATEQAVAEAADRIRAYLDRL